MVASIANYFLTEDLRRLKAPKEEKEIFDHPFISDSKSDINMN